MSAQRAVLLGIALLLPSFQQSNATVRPRIVHTSVAATDVGHTPAQIACHFAPFLEFSPDEKHFPTSIPCDVQSALPVVYYTVTDSHSSVHEGEEWVESLRIRYWFYFEDEDGYFKHGQDLEGVVIHVRRIFGEDGQARYAATAAMGDAHAISELTNQLYGEISYPPAVMIEEGKHATCPDRTIDLQYVPGDDVSFRVRNAWGIRDLLASGTLGITPGYHGYMTKNRHLRDTWLPPSPVARKSLRAAGIDGCRTRGVYKLREISEIDANQCTGDDARKLLDQMKDERQFGIVPALREVHETLLDLVSMRWDRDRSYFVAALPYGVLLDYFTQYRPVRMVRDFVPGEIVFRYLAPTANWDSGDPGWDLMYTPNAVYWNTWYLAAGRDPGARSALELGLRFRLPTRKDAWQDRLSVLTWIPSLVVPRILGARVGIRANDYDHLDDGRLVFEIGSGLY